MAAWRSFDTFAACLAGSFASALTAMAIAVGEATAGSPLEASTTSALLDGLYFVTYPLGAVALAALLAHFVRLYSGRTAT